MVFARQSFFILLAIGITIFIKSIFVNSIVSILGILAILYLGFFNRKKLENFSLFVLITLVLILVVLTGEITSPFFFLFYFLSFAIVFIFDPKVVFVFTIGIIILLFPSALKDDLTHNLILLFSLFLLSPLTFFAGTDYRKKQNAKKKIRDMKKKVLEIENDIEEIEKTN